MNADEIHVLATTGLDAPFWDGLADGAVRLPRCADCAQWVWPAQPRCPGCTSATLEWHDVRPNGRLYSWTRTWYPFVPARAEDLPYVVVLVELPAAGGVRLLGVYDGEAKGDLVIGAAMRGRIAPPSDRSFGLPSLVWASVFP